MVKKGDEKLHAKADERKGGEKGDKKLHEEAEKKKKEPNPGSKKNPLKIDSIKDIHKDAAYQKITIDGHEATIVNRGTYDEDTHKPIYYVEAGSQTHAYTGLDMLKEKIEEFVRVANGGKADSDDKKK